MQPLTADTLRRVREVGQQWKFYFGAFSGSVDRGEEIGPGGCSQKLLETVSVCSSLYKPRVEAVWQIQTWLELRSGSYSFCSMAAVAALAVNAVRLPVAGERHLTQEDDLGSFVRHQAAGLHQSWGLNLNSGPAMP